MTKTPRTKKAAAAKPEPEKVSVYDRVAKRLVDAVDELNGALKEAGALEEIRVELGDNGKVPRQFHYRIYRLTHTCWEFEVIEKPYWAEVKDTATKLRARVFHHEGDAQ